MNDLSQSHLRSALQVSPERLVTLTQEDLDDLMLELLTAQAQLCGSPRSELRINGRGNASDGGSDCWTSAPLMHDEWLGDSSTCWQLKAGVGGQPKKLVGEVSKPIPRRTLKEGGRFVVVTSGSSNGIKGERDRLEKLILEAQSLGLPTGKIEVIGSERLALWCGQHPAIALRFSGINSAVSPLSDWLNFPVHQVEWQASSATRELLATFQADLSFESGPIQHLHVHGQPGVGKTRFALELCRNAPWAPFVVYFRQAVHCGLEHFVHAMSREKSVRVVVVADEVQQNQLEPLTDAVSASEGRIRLISIGLSKSPEPARIRAFQLQPLDRHAISLIVRGWHQSMPNDHIDFIAKFADGYIKLAKLAANAVMQDRSLTLGRLLTLEEIEPPRLSWRLQQMRRWSHDEREDESIFA